jgi:hypothetical protein
MSELTKAARGQECTIQIHPYCNMNPETTVFCHAPSEDKGWSIKSPDWWGADGCSDCHDIVDGRATVDDISSSEVWRCFVRGIHRTINRRIEQGLIKV